MSIEALKKQVDGDHYRKMAIQPVEYIVENNIPFREGCIIKYVTRHKTKGRKNDILKAMHLLEMILETEYKHVWDVDA